MGQRTGPLEGVERRMNLEFYRGKRVLVTGHTGFKGAWLCRILVNAGAEVTGYALDPPTEPNLYTLAGLAGRMASVRGDVRDSGALERAMHTARPELVFHLAAQPIVRTGYEQPVLTYETNVMGTVRLLECIRRMDCVRSFLNITTDKVYYNREWEWGYRENEALDGQDPYSNSKSCSELVTHSYRDSFFRDTQTAISTARAGNVIGGGDFARDRIIPDCVRAVSAGEPIVLRNPASVRPYQHVLEALSAYLLIARRQYEDKSAAGSYNVGPDESGCVTTGALADLFCTAWGPSAHWESGPDGGPHEASYLKLDCSRIRNALGWRPRWNIEDAVRRTVEWTKNYLRGGNVPDEMDREMEAYFRDSMS